MKHRRLKVRNSWQTFLLLIAFASCGVPENSIEVKTAREAAARNCVERGKCVADPKGLVLYNSDLVTESKILVRARNETIISKIINLIDEPKLLVASEKLEPHIRGFALVREFEPCDSPKAIDGKNPTVGKLRVLKEGRYKACIAYIGDGLFKKTFELDPIQVDTTPPDVSGVVTASAISATSAVLNWSRAGDNITLEGDLEYQVYLSTSKAMSTLLDVRNYGAQQPGKVQGITAYALSGLSEQRDYYAAVVVRDEAGNEAFVGSTPFKTTVFDVDTPSVSISSNRDPGPTNQSEITLTFRFSEPVTGFDIGDVVVGSATKGLFSALSSTVFTLNVTATGSAVSASVPENVLKDLTGNGNMASAPWSIFYDNTPPTVTITTAVPLTTNVSPIPVTITFSESVTGFDLSDITVGNGTAESLSGSGSTYTASITPAADGGVTVDIAANRAQDAATNGNSVATQLSRTYDTTPPSSPSVVINGSADYTNATAATLTLSAVGASEMYVSNTAGCASGGSWEAYGTSKSWTLGQTNATATVYAKYRDAVGNETACVSDSIIHDSTAPLAPVISDAAKSFNVSFATTIQQGVPIDANFKEFRYTTSGVDPTCSTGTASSTLPTSVTIPAATTTLKAISCDQVGQGSPVTSVTYTYDNASPTVAITSNRDPGPTNNSSVLLTFTFSKAVTGFDAGDVSVSNATKGAFTSTSSTVYTMEITPTASVVSASVAANSAIDSASNGNLASTPWSITYDSLAPTVTITSTSPAVTNVSPIPVTITFSESVTGFDLSDITVGNGTAGSLSGSGSTYTASITPAADGGVTVDIAANRAQDSATNGNTAATQLSRTYDTTPPSSPSVVINGSAAYTSATAATLTLSAVGASEMYVSNTAGCASGGSWEAYGTSKSWTLGQTNATATVYAKYRDAVGNETACVSDSIIHDSTAPVAPVISDAAKSFNVSFATTIQQGVPIDANFKEFRYTTSGVDPTCSTGTASSTLPTSVTIPAATTTLKAISCDQVGQGSSVTSVTYTYDNASPTVAITSNRDPGPTNNSSILLTFTFSEDVTGFDATDVSVTNAAKGEFTSTSSTVYTLAITATGSNITANVAAGAANDSAGNSNMSASQWNMGYDQNVPALALNAGQTSNVTSTLGTQTWTGTCQAAISTITVTDYDSRTLTCSSGTWTYTTPVTSRVGRRTYTLTQTNAVSQSATLTLTWTRDGIVSTVTGTGFFEPNPYTPISALSRELNHGTHIALDSNGDIYFADSWSNNVKRITSAGMVTTIAGAGLTTSSGDGGPATAANLSFPQGVAVDSSWVYITEGNNIRRIDKATGVITTFAGSTSAGYADATGSAARFNVPSSIARDSAGNFYVADEFNHRIRRISTTGVVTTVAGNGDTTVLNAPRFAQPDSAGNLLYVSDSRNNRVLRVVISTGATTTIAGTGVAGNSGNGGAATSAQLNYPSALALDEAGGRLFVADQSNGRIRTIDLNTGIITSTSAEWFWHPRSLIYAAPNDLYISDSYNLRIKRMNITTGVTTNIGGNGFIGREGLDGPATAAPLTVPRGLALDSSGRLYIANARMHQVRRVGNDGIIRLFAGAGTACNTCNDNIQASAAWLNNPMGLTLDSFNNVYIVDGINIRRVDESTGIISTVAGSNTSGFSGDGGAATAAQLNNATGIAVDSAGNLYIADSSNHRIRRVSAANGVITTIAGTGVPGNTGNGGPATLAQINNPQGIAVDSSGNVYFSQSATDIVRKIDNTSGIITIVAGAGTNGFSGDGGLAVNAQLNRPRGLAIDSQDNLYIVDASNNRIRMVDTLGRISTIAGTGILGDASDGGLATQSNFRLNDSSFMGIWVDASGSIYFSDVGNHKVRKITP